MGMASLRVSGHVKHCGLLAFDGALVLFQCPFPARLLVLLQSDLQHFPGLTDVAFSTAAARVSVHDLGPFLNWEWILGLGQH